MSLRRIPRPDRWSLREWRLFATAVGAVATARVVLWSLSFARIRTRLEAPLPDRPKSADAPSAREIARAVDRARRVVPRASCLVQAMAAKALLDRAGVSSAVWIGVSREGGAFDAHAWVESGGEVVLGHRVGRHYVPVTKLGAAR